MATDPSTTPDEKTSEITQSGGEPSKAETSSLPLPQPDPVEILNPVRTFLANDLLVWKHSLRGIRFGLCPPHTCLPNPALYDDLVVASTFSPGCICALDKTTGERRWMQRLAYFGHTPQNAGGYLLGGTSQSLLCLSPETGKTLWEFAPYQDQRENIYSLPVVANGSVFLGDRQGRFYCLSAATGEEIWSVETSRSRNSDVNATALVFEDLIITATNAKLVLAYNQITGEEVWRQHLPDCSTYQIQWYDGMILVQTTQVLYGLSPTNGAILQRWRWRGQEIVSVAVAEVLLCVVVTNEPGVRGGKVPAHPRTELLGIHRDDLKWRLPYPRYCGVGLRWDRETRLLYEAMYLGLGIVDPQSGKRLALVNGFVSDLSFDHVGLPSVTADTLYLLHTQGTMWALRHP